MSGQTILGFAGAAVGSMFGMPQLGYAVGSALGGALFAPTQKSEGPRLGELRVTSSTQGKALPYVYGQGRIAGDLIWALNIEEVVSTQTQGGKGGPTQESTTYSYFGTAAYSLGEGPISAIRKVWINSELVWDISNPADVANEPSTEPIQATFGGAGGQGLVAQLIANQTKSDTKLGQYMRVYYGTETQMPDSRIEADKGEGLAPAYRGTAYVVFDRLPLADYGNRLPNVEFEVVGLATNTSFSAVAAEFPLKNYNGARQSILGAYAYHDGEVYAAFGRAASEANQSADGLDVYKWIPGEGVRYLSGLGAVGAAFGASSTNPMYMRARGDAPTIAVQVRHDTAGGYQYMLHVFDIASGQRVSIPTPTGGFIDRATAARHGKNLALASFPYAGDGGTIYYVPGSSQAIRTMHVPGVIGITDLAMDAQYIYALAVLTTTTVALVKISRDTLAVISTSVPLPAAEPANAIAMHVGGGVVYVAGIGLHAPGSCAVMRLEGDAWARVGTYSTAPDISSQAGWSMHSGYISHACGFLYCNGQFAIVDAADNSPFTPGVAFITLVSPTDGETTVGAIVADQCVRAGISPTQIDVSEIAADTIGGYVVGSRMSGRSAIEPLRKYAFFDGLETDWGLKFPKRGGAPVATIEQSKLVSDGIEIVRTQELELPREIAIRFYDSTAAYQTGSQYARRLVTSANQAVDVDLPIAMEPARAAQIAQAALYEAWASRNAVSFSTTLDYAAVEPCDVVLVQVDGVEYRVRITAKDDFGGELKFGGLIDDEAAVVQHADITDGGYIPQKIYAPGTSELFVLDGPSIRDQDTGSIYVAAAGFSSDWRGAAVLQSADGIAYTARTSTDTAALHGLTESTLAAGVSPDVVDESAVLMVAMSSGELSGCNYTQMLAGQNTAYIGQEIVSFRDAELVGGTVAQPLYRLRGLLRGRKGTEVTAHAVGERFVQITEASLKPLSFQAADMRKNFALKALSFGRTDGLAQSVTIEDAGYKPNAPLHAAAGRSAYGAVTLQWIRATRTDQAWRDFGGGALDESVESYEIDILSPGGDVLRTLTSSTPSVDYGLAAQYADWSGFCGDFTAKIYQISSVVGRGRGATYTFAQGAPASVYVPPWAQGQTGALASLTFSTGTIAGTVFGDGLRVVATSAAVANLQLLRLSDAAPGRDLEISFDATLGVATTGGPGVAFRTTVAAPGTYTSANPPPYAYAVQLLWNGSQWRVSLEAGGNSAGTGPTGAILGGADTGIVAGPVSVRVSAQGPLIRVWINGVLLITASDSRFLFAGGVFLMGYSGYGTSGIVYRNLKISSLRQLYVDTLPAGAYTVTGAALRTPDALRISATGASTSAAAPTGSPFYADGRAEVEMTVPATISGAIASPIGAGLEYRWAGTAVHRDCYVVALYAGYLQRYHIGATGTVTGLVNVPLPTLTAGKKVNLAVEVTGTAHAATIDGVTVSTWTNATKAAGGRVALHAVSQATYAVESDFSNLTLVY